MSDRRFKIDDLARVKLPPGHDDPLSLNGEIVHVAAVGLCAPCIERAKASHGDYRYDYCCDVPGFPYHVFFMDYVLVPWPDQDGEDWEDLQDRLNWKPSRPFTIDDYVRQVDEEITHAHAYHN